MSRRIFISHAGEDIARAKEVATQLENAGLIPLLDRDRINLGDSFLSFMEEGLATSDYFLLLWSAQAAVRDWVRLEWEAALHRAVSEARGFLIVGRLDQHPLPSLLAPRLFVSLYPELWPGLGELVRLCQKDQQVATIAGKPIASNALLADQAAGESVYVTSELFGVTVPVSIDLKMPAGVVQLHLLERLSLPKSLSHQGQIGVRFEYHLIHAETVLDAAKPLCEQGIQAGSVLKLQCSMIPIAATAPISGKLDAVVFRSPDAVYRAIQAGKRELATRVRAANLAADVA